MLELPGNNKHLGLYTPDGRYVAGTKMISSTLPILKNKEVLDWKQVMEKSLHIFKVKLKIMIGLFMILNYNCVGMFKENMIQGFGMVRGSLMNEKEIKISEIEVEFDFFETSFRTMDDRILINCKRDICL